MLLWQTVENPKDSIWLDLNNELKPFRDELDNLDKPDYSLSQKWNIITLSPANEDNGNIKITVENWNLNFFHSTEWFLSEWDLELLTEDEKNNDEKLNKINQVLKTYSMPLLKPEDSIYLLLIIDGIKNLEK